MKQIKKDSLKKISCIETSNYCKTKQNNSWKNTLKYAFHLVVFDFLWSLPLALLGFLIVAQQQLLPVNTFCMLLKQEVSSNKTISLPIFVIFVEIGIALYIYLLPMVVFFLLVEPRYTPILQLIRNWWSVFKTTGLCFCVDITYRLFMFFTFAHPLGAREARDYPQNYSALANLLWLFSSFIIVKQMCRIWTAKQSSHLILHHQVPPQDLKNESKAVEITLRRKIMYSLILTAVCAISIKILMMRVFQIGEESHRTLLIVITLGMALPAWMVLDRKGRTGLPWPLEARSKLAKHCTDIGSNSLTTRSFDEIEENGFILSALIVAGMNVVTRALQANMTNFQNKFLIGIMASSIESIFTIIKPQILRCTHKKLSSTKEFFASRVYKSSRIGPKLPQSNKNDQIKENDMNQVYSWQRAHMVVLMNRLEMFSILFGNGLVIMSVNVNNRALEWSLLNDNYSSNSINECKYMDNALTIALETLILCLMESLIEFVTYVYMLHVENLPLDQIIGRKRLNISLIFFTLSAVLFFIGEMLTTSFVVLSCNNVDEYLFHYQCVYS